MWEENPGIASADNTPRENAWNADRSGRAYVDYFDGIENFLTYVKNLQTSNLIVDVGAGTTRAIADIAKSDMGLGLRFEATVLLNYKHEDGLPRDAIHNTPVETLAPFDDASVGGILSACSVAYSKAPKLAVASIDRVLVPGGVFKGLFLRTDFIPRADTQVLKEMSMITPFNTLFRERGYDVSFRNSTQDLAILLAVKRSDLAENAISSAKLMEADYESQVEQIHNITRRLFKR